MCRESRMSAVLTENLFIDVASDAARLKRPEVIAAIVNGHVEGIAKFLGLKKKETGSKMDKANVIAYGKKVDDGLLIDGKVYVPLRAVAEARGDKVDWNNTTKTATVCE